MLHTKHWGEHRECFCCIESLTIHVLKVPENDLPSSPAFLPARELSDRYLSCKSAVVAVWTCAMDLTEERNERHT